MAQAKDMALRQSVIEQRSRGMSLQGLAARYGLSYGTVQGWCRRHAAGGIDALGTRYAACGKRRPAAQHLVYRAVRCMKQWHPTWGAEKIRQVLLQLRPTLVLPPARTLQHWFVYSGQAGQRRSRVPKEAARWAKAVHEGWQIDAKEELTTQDGMRQCWLNIKDECSGAVIDPTVFPLWQNQ